MFLFYDWFPMKFKTNCHINLKFLKVFADLHLQQKTKKKYDGKQKDIAG